MLTENEIVQKVADYLREDGYEVLQSLNTSEKGVDIVARKNEFTLYVEAKGATSSKPESSRFGKAFSKNQVSTHVAVALLASMKILSSKVDARVGIALPDNKDHKDLISGIQSTLDSIGILVFFVGEDGVEKVESTKSD